MSEVRYRGGGAERPLAKHPAGPRGTPHPTEKRYATQGTRARQRGRDRTDDERPGELSPLLEIVRHDEQHHYGRHSVERRQEEQPRRQRDRGEEEQTERRMRREQRGRSYGGRRRGPQSRS